MEACVTFLMLLLAGVVLAEETVAPSSKPMLPATSGAEFRTIVALHGKALQTVAETRRQALSRLLQQHLDEADQLLKERKKTRNVTGVAVATTARDLFASALTNLEATGSFEMPEKVRRELETTMADFNTARQRVETTFANDKARIRKEHLDQFAAALYKIAPAAKRDGSEALIEARFDEMVAGKDTQATPPAGGGVTNAPAVGGLASGTTNVPSVAGSAPELPRIMGSSGEAAEWATVGQWSGTMMGLDVITVPLLEMQKGTNTQDHFNPIVGENSKWEYVALQVLPPASGMVFRLRRVPERLGVEPVEWPSPRNNHSLVIRVPPADSTNRPAFDLQVALPGRDLGSFFAGAALESSASAKPLPPVTLSIQTVPPGASVWVDAVLLRDLWTPCRVRIPGGGRHALRLALPGYLPVSVTNQSFPADRVLKWTFQPDPRVVRKSLAVSAGSEGWTTDGTRVSKGDSIAVEVEGSWSCGSGKELCDTLGYPNNDAFFRYYMDTTSHPRQFVGANYGALLMRIGETGRPIPVGKSLKVSAPEGGSLSFDINEAAGKTFRQDNASALMLRLMVMPADVADFPH
jgi:hypothetical protein